MLDDALREAVCAAVREELTRFFGEAPSAGDLMTPAEAGKLLRRSAKAVRDLVTAKRLTRYGTSERILVSRREIQALVTAPPPRRAKRIHAKKMTAAQVAAHLMGGR